MRIKDFKLLISSLPFLQQSFTIKKSNWDFASKADTIHDIFGKNQFVTLTRNDLFTSAINDDLERFIVKTLMWGYPTKGRGKNIEFLLESASFDNLLEILVKYKERNVFSNQFHADINSIKGLGLSTMSKFIYFLNSKIENQKALILDQRIMDTINSGKYEELSSLKGIRSDNATSKYLKYLTIINNLKSELAIEADKIEMFLFIFGKTLTEI
jgi:thermostable 8-oxoguanine DNA glycosylase